MSKPGLLTLTIKDKSALYLAYMPYVINGGLFIPTNSSYRLGDEVFMLLNLIATFLWAGILGSVSFLLGAVMTAMLKRFEVLEHYAIVIVAVAGAAIWLAHFILTRRRNARFLESEESSAEPDKSRETGV